MKVLGIIPARYASSRFPGKPLIDLKGKTMIQRVYEGAKRSSQITELVVATDDSRIYDEVIRFGGKVMMSSENHCTGTDRCAEVAKKYPEMDIIINIQGDEPLVDYRQLDQLIAAFSNSKTQIATLGNSNVTLEDLENPNRIKVVLNKNNQALYFSRSAIPNHHHLHSDPLEFYPYLKHIGLYAFRADIIQQLTTLEPCILEKIESLEQLRWLFYGFAIDLVITEFETPNIDVPEDINKVLELL